MRDFKILKVFKFRVREEIVKNRRLARRMLNAFPKLDLVNKESPLKEIKLNLNQEKKKMSNNRT